MAQTKRKRRTKHRGNAAGSIEARGRTGRKPTSDEKRSAREDARARRLERLDRPPSWRSAFNRALLATAILFVLSVTVLGFSVTRAAALMPVVLLVYVPVGYATDMVVYRMRQRRKAGG